MGTYGVRILVHPAGGRLPSPPWRHAESDVAPRRAFAANPCIALGSSCGPAQVRGSARSVARMQVCTPDSDPDRIRKHHQRRTSEQILEAGIIGVTSRGPPVRTGSPAPKHFSKRRPEHRSGSGRSPARLLEGPAADPMPIRPGRPRDHWGDSSSCARSRFVMTGSSSPWAMRSRISATAALAVPVLPNRSSSCATRPLIDAASVFRPLL